MHSSGSGGDGDIEAVVNVDSGRPIRCRYRSAREIEQGSPRQILLANLHPIRPCLDGETNFREQLRNLINRRVNYRVNGA